MAQSNIEHELDRLVQVWASRQRSMYSGKLGCVGHHIVSRKHKMLRWDLRNIMPLTPEEHRLLHDGLIVAAPDCETQLYLDEMRNTDYKNWLLFNGLTEQEFFIQEKAKLKSELVDKFLYKSCKSCW